MSRNSRRSGSFFKSLNPFSRPVDRALEWKRSRQLRVEALEDRRLLAIRVLPGFEANALDRGDAVAELAGLPFEINFFETSYDELIVDTNGYIRLGTGFSNPPTGNSGQSEEVPTTFGEGEGDVRLSDLQLPIIAPFWSDINTTDMTTGTVTYGTDTVN